MKEVNRRQFFNLLGTGAVALVGAATASAAKKTITAVTDPGSALSESINDNTEAAAISSNAESKSDLMLAGSVRRSSRRAARRTARRTSRRVNRRQEVIDEAL
jgi:hypothetical protein